MLLGGSDLAQHRPWIIGCTLALAAAVAWYWLESLGQPTWPGGSSRPGFTFGVLAGLIILFEAALWLRKKLRAWRLGKMTAWMRAHIWLGLLSVPLVLLHCGFKFNGTLAVVLTLIYALVIASGVWGLWLQQVLPQRMYAEIPAETIYSQIPQVMQGIIDEQTALVDGLIGRADDALVGQSVSASMMMVSLSVGASVGQTMGGSVAGLVGAAILQQAYEDRVRPFLELGRRSHSPLVQRSEAARFFADLRARVDAAAEPVIASLERACEVRRQLDRQATLHAWLHGWLLLHTPLSVALIGLLVAHAYSAIVYWGITP